jgi:hypothetical protein
MGNYFSQNSLSRRLVVTATLVTILCVRALADDHHVQLSRGGSTVIVVDNQPITEGPAAGHAAGYNGLAYWRRDGQQANLFVPKYAGLNFEHIHDGTMAVEREKYEPRKSPMSLHRTDEFSIELRQSPTPNWLLESVGRYRLLEDGVIEYEFECTPRGETFTQGYIGLFWASYMNAPSERGLRFLGRRIDAPNDQPHWIEWLPKEHGVDATHRPVNDTRQIRFDPEFPLTLANHPSPYLWTSSWSYGIVDGWAFVQMFQPSDRIWLTQSPTGGGNTNPAWDFQWFVDSPKVGQTYRFRMRAAVVKFESTEQLEKNLAEHFQALGISN